MSLEVIGIILNTIGAILLASSIFKSEEEIKDESSTYYNGNPFLLKNFKSSKNIGIIGLFIFILGFSFILVEKINLPFTIEFQKVIIILLVLSISALLFFWLQFIKRKKHHNYKLNLAIKNTNSILEKYKNKEINEIQLINSLKSRILIFSDNEYQEILDEFEGNKEDREKFQQYIQELEEYLNKF